MGKPKGLMQVSWESRFIDRSKYLCAYYTLFRQEGNYVNTIIETGVR